MRQPLQLRRPLAALTVLVASVCGANLSWAQDDSRADVATGDRAAEGDAPSTAPDGPEPRGDADDGASDDSATSGTRDDSGSVDSGPVDDSPGGDGPDDSARDTSATGAKPPPSITLPQIASSTSVPYPEGAQGSARVVLIVTVLRDGSVDAIEVEESAGAAFDEAARRGVADWSFAAATRDGQAIAARARVAVDFEEPALEPTGAALAAPVDGGAVVPAEGATSPTERDGAAEKGDRPHNHPNDSHLEVTVHGNRAPRAERRGASDFFLHRETLLAAPHAEGADVLKAAPGLYMARPAGMAMAHSYSLRGFDSAHGQDIEFNVGGLPVNLPSHIHGQGYADLGFLIGETVDHLVVKEGVRDPKQGDFAVAGSIDIGLGVDEPHRGIHASSTYGSFDTFQQKVIWAPKEAPRESFGAAQYTTTDGFGENRAGQSATGMLQHRFGQGPVTYRAIGFAHTARGDSAGLVRRDDIEDGTVCFHCTYDDPSARAQYTQTQRLMAGIFADYTGADHASGTLGFWLGLDNFRTQRNFTGYTETSTSLENTSGRGDLIEQTNQTTSLGLVGRYRTEGFHLGEANHGTFEVGTDGRFDLIGQQQNLLDAAVRNQTWDERVRAEVDALQIGMWGDIDFQFAEVVKARLGLRAAVVSYAVTDELGNYAPLTRPQDTYLVGFRRSSMGTSVGPRTSVEVKTLDWLSLLASYGLGYRTPQARTLEDGETAPFAEVHSADAGARMRFGEPLELTVVGYYTHLSDDVAFEPAEGTLERIGPTRRLGATAHAISRPFDWLLTSASLTIVEATLEEPPAATAEEPSPAYEEGQRLPYVPPVVLRIDAKAKHPLAQAGKFPLEGSLGLGFSYLSPRPLPYGEYADPVPLLDASAGLGWGPLDFTLSGYNLMNLDYAAQEYVFVSDWSPGDVPSRLPERHIAAGAPLTILGTLGVTL